MPLTHEARTVAFFLPYRYRVVLSPFLTEGIRFDVPSAPNGMAKSDPLGVKPSITSTRTLAATAVDSLVTFTYSPSWPGAAADRSMVDCPLPRTVTLPDVARLILPTFFVPYISTLTVVGLDDGFANTSCWLEPVPVEGSRNAWLMAGTTQVAAEMPRRSPSEAWDARMPVWPDLASAFNRFASNRRG